MQAVELDWKRNRGWPWPEKNFGLTPMYGEDGWCRNCAIPNRPQVGPLILQRRAMRPEGAWVPYWREDLFCVSDSVAQEVTKRFRVDVIPVGWHGESPGGANQLVAPTAAEPWFDHAELEGKVLARHGSLGSTCPECGVWRWMPIAGPQLPPFRIKDPLAEGDIVASPEWFGVGLKSFHQVLVRRELADFLVHSSPKDFALEQGY
jgi:hypothetical protein